MDKFAAVALVVIAIILTAGCVNSPKKDQNNADGHSDVIPLRTAIVAVRQAIEQASKECEDADADASKVSQACTKAIYLSDVTLTLEVSKSTTNTIDTGGGVKDVFNVNLSHAATSDNKNTVELKFQNPMFLGASPRVIECLDPKNASRSDCRDSRFLRQQFYIPFGEFPDSLELHRETKPSSKLPPKSKPSKPD